MAKQRSVSSLPTLCPLPLEITSFRGGTNSSGHCSTVTFSSACKAGTGWNRATHTLGQLAFVTGPFLSCRCPSSLCAGPESLCVHSCLVTQSCLTLVTPWTVAARLHCHGIFQARILEWVAISSGGGDLPDSGIKPTSPVSPAFQVDSLPTRPLGKLPEFL